MYEQVRLTIGEVAELTGIKPGRIRHYEDKGLVSPPHEESGYRSFGASEVLRLLYVDLLRRSGLGLDAIGASLDTDEGDLRIALQRHAAALRHERERLGRILRVVESALAEAPSGDGQEDLVARLARMHAGVLGPFGRLAVVLSPEAETAVERLLLADWELEVPELFSQMLLPEPVTDLLEALVRAGGHEVMFDRLRALAQQIVALGDGPGALDGARDLGAGWITEQLEDPLPEEVAEVLRALGPNVAELPVVREGFLLWSEAVSPAASACFGAMAAEARRRGVGVIGAVVIPP